MFWLFAKIIYKRTLLVALLVIFMVSFNIRSTLAIEITPSAGSYSYGSSSEFSPYTELTGGYGPIPPGPEPTSTTLAPTGQNTWPLYIVAILAITTPLTYFGIKKLKNR
jgi:hypothetical protein